MDEIVVKAPANVKIAGEHSVVYGGPSLAVAIELFATARISDSGTDKLEIVLKDLKLSRSFDAKELESLYKEYSTRDTSKPDGIARYVAKNEQNVGSKILPYATIAARLFGNYGISMLGRRVVIHSDVPVQKGYASSAICSAAFAMALVRASGKKIDDQTAMDVIRDGERIVHKAETAGRIDVGPAYLGGFARFSSSEGIKKEKISTQIDIIVIDTGPKPPTAEMVGKVRALYNKDTEGTTKILRKIDECVEKGISALKSGNLRELGKQMSRNHELLKELGVSSEGLDRAVSVAVKSGAYGAKLCGGGGGGMAVALVNGAEAPKVVAALKANMFDAYLTSIALKGARDSD